MIIGLNKMVYGTAQDLRTAIKRLEHFARAFKSDGPFTALTPFGRNLALFYDGADKPDYMGDFVLCAGAGAILCEKCNQFRIADRFDIQAEIAAWWWRANEHVNWRIWWS